MDQCERERIAVMDVVVVVPTAAFQLAMSTYDVNVVDIVEFEDKTVFTALGLYQSVQKSLSAGLPATIATFSHTNSVKAIWRETVRYDATGLRIGETHWEYDADLTGIILSKLIMLLGGDGLNDSEHANLGRYSLVLSAPDFCPNQLEYGKRYKMRAMLLN